MTTLFEWPEMHSWEWTALAILCATLALLFYTYAGFPMVMAVLAKVPSWLKNQSTLPGPLLKKLSVILCVHNEETRLAARLQNLLKITWPLDGEVVVVCDGCTDKSAEVARGVDEKRVRVLELPQKSGKPTALNAGVEHAEGDVLVFCDARQEFDRKALVKLIEALGEGNTGAVSGLLRIATAADGASAGFDKYWSLETRLRKWESDWDSAVGCTGAIYALRRECFVPLEVDTILDDVVIPMQAVMQGWRVGYSMEAIAWDPQPLAPEVEQRRKLRTLAGNFQMLFHHAEWLNPLKNRVWWQLISHKYLRISSPLFLAVALVSTAALASHPLFMVLLVTEVGLLGLAWLALASPAVAARVPGVRLPAAFLSMQLTIIRGFAAYLRHKNNMLDLWKTAPHGVTRAKERC